MDMAGTVIAPPFMLRRSIPRSILVADIEGGEGEVFVVGFITIKPAQKYFYASCF